jgi:hypothetical protein
MSRGGIERRSEPRLAARLAITVGLGERSFLAYSQNVSGSGAFLECAESIEHGATLDLRFAVPNDPEPIATSAEVRWVARNADGTRLGVGIRLGALRPREMRAWARFLRTLRDAE